MFLLCRGLSFIRVASATPRLAPSDGCLGVFMSPSVQAGVALSLSAIALARAQRERVRACLCSCTRPGKRGRDLRRRCRVLRSRAYIFWALRQRADSLCWDVRCRQSALVRDVPGGVALRRCTTPLSNSA